MRKEISISSGSGSFLLLRFIYRYLLSTAHFPSCLLRWLYLHYPSTFLSILRPPYTTQWVEPLLEQLAPLHFEVVPSSNITFVQVHILLTLYSINDIFLTPQCKTIWYSIMLRLHFTWLLELFIYGHGVFFYIHRLQKCDSCETLSNII